MPSFDPAPIMFGDAQATAAVLESPVFTPGLDVTETDEVVTTTVSYSYEVEQAADVERLVANHQRTDLIATGAFTTWQQLRDYVCAAIEVRVAAFPRNPVKEKAIFESFMNRWGDRAEPIARRAVEVHDCWWGNAPLSVTRFCKGSDPYFAEVLVTQL